jgi:hypothetical protein
MCTSQPFPQRSSSAGRYRTRQRALVEPDLLIMASDHWNFDVRAGSIPRGNHGSFLRPSTHSTFMLAGGEGTGIRRGLEITEPYDSLSYMPTVLSLMGRLREDNEPDEGLKALGFRRFPGRVVRDIIGPLGAGRGTGRILIDPLTGSPAWRRRHCR